MSRLEMDAATLAQVSKLLDEALEQPPAARVSWIDSLDPRFDGLKPRLRDLLSRAASVETGEFLNTIPKVIAADAALAPGARAGELIGPYRLMRELGSGGMGAVWLAERADGLISRQIALKLPHLVTPRRAELAERMAREREILAALDHRNIAKLFDAGLTAEGQPYLALEYIEGVPIDQYVHGTSGGAALPLGQRLRLFLQVAHAVAYAHGKLVVHRDLKPANILVGPNGGVRLLDFGIAKLIEDGEAKATQLTQFAGGAFTPDYASPEQILGRPLTVASDVYSLGVVLYELLTGTRPYRLKRESRAALEDAILQAEPRRPSDAAPAALRKALRGDLDTILLKALKKDPLERYATATAFAEDVERHLANRPVRARPDNAMYRLRKFIVRNKLGVSVTALVLLAIISGAGVAVWQARVAIAEQRRADEVKGFLVQLFKSANPSFNGGRKVTVDQLLLASRAKISEEFAGRPEIRIELLSIVGENLSAIGEPASALPIYQEAVATAEKAFGPDHVLTLHARSMALSARRDIDPSADVTADTDQLIDAMRRNPDVDPAYFSNLLSVRAHIAMNNGKFPEAVKFATEALQISRTKIGEDTDQNLGNATLLALAHQRNGDWRSSLAAATEVRRLAIDVRKLPGEHFTAVDARLMHGMALADAGQLRAGLDEMSEAMRFALISRKADDAPIGSFRTHLARYQMRAGLEHDALENVRAGVDILRNALGDKSRRVSATRAELGLMYLTMRRPADAVAPLQSAASFFAGSTDLGNAVVPARLAVASAQSHSGGESGIPGPSGDFKSWELPYRAAQLERLAHRPAAAQPLLQQSLQMLGDAPAEQMPRAEVTLEMGRVQFDLGQFAAAQRSFNQSIERVRAVQLQPSSVLGDAELWLGRALLAQHSVEATAALERAVADWARIDDQHPLANEARQELSAMRTLNASAN